MIRKNFPPLKFTHTPSVANDNPFPLSEVDSEDKSRKYTVTNEVQEEEKPEKEYDIEGIGPNDKEICSENLEKGKALEKEVSLGTVDEADKEVALHEVEKKKTPEKEVVLPEVDEKTTPEKEVALPEVHEKKTPEKEVVLHVVEQEKKEHYYNTIESTEFISNEIKKQGQKSFEDGRNEIVSETTLSASSPNEDYDAFLDLSIESVLDDPAFKNLCLYKKKKKIASQVAISNDGSLKANFPLMMSVTRYQTI